MKSIRTYLLLSLIAIITLVIFVSLLQGYNSSIQKAQQIFDDRLVNIAEIIAGANQDTVGKTMMQFPSTSALFFQIWNEDKQLLTRSSNAPARFITDLQSSNPFQEVNFANYRWRTFILRDSRLHRWIVAGERIDVRSSLAENIVLASIIPVVIAIPVAAMIIWFAVGLGLKPLKDLSLQLSRKQANDLSPVGLPNLPDELKQLVTTINALLERLHRNFEREKQFTADVAHELRTPISLLKVQFHNLEAEYNHQHKLKPLADAIERMGLVVEQILSLYRHSHEQHIHNKETVDLKMITQQLIVDSYEQLSSKQQQISLSSDEGMLIQGNQFALETMLQNLITNANKYTPEQGKIAIIINKTQTSIRFLIEDSGPGIEKALRERVFERFYRVHGDQHPSGILGCGLGLAIVKHIADLHQAKIILGESSLGGLSVMIDFPLIYSDKRV